MVMADQQHASLTELPGSVDFADLKLCNDNFGLLTATGIYYGKIDRTLSSQPLKSSGAGSSMIVDSGILPYEVATGKSTLLIPVSLAVTPHHLIVLTESNDIHFINRVAQKVIQKDKVDLGTSLDDFGELIMDIRRPDQVWLRKARSLVHISSSQEDRDVWKFTLQKGLDMPISSQSSSTSPSPSSTSLWSSRSAPNHRMTPSNSLTPDEKAQEAVFEHAKALCTTAAQKAVVTAIRAEYHLSQGHAELAAKYFAQSPPTISPFADTSIRLALPKLGIDDPSSYGDSWKARAGLESSNLPLITYLSDKMRSGDKMMSTMIGAWLAELYLHERGERLATMSLDGECKDSREEKTSQRAMLAHFLTSNVNNMDAKTIMKILTSHDVGAAECSTYAASSGDIATAVSVALSVEDSVRTVVDILLMEESSQSHVPCPCLD
jgi:hypothetical protein